MSYVTKQQLVERFGADKLAQLTDRFGDGDLDDQVLAAAIADAARSIDAYVAPRYMLPLDQDDIDASPLSRIAGDLVVYYLQGDLATEDAERRHKEAMGFLRDVQAGRASLGQDDTTAVPSGRSEMRSGLSANYDWAGY